MARVEVSPIFVSAATAAKLIEISEDTWRAWIANGIAPPPAIKTGQIVRWHWPTVEAALAGAREPGLDMGDLSMQKVMEYAKGKANGRS